MILREISSVRRGRGLAALFLVLALGGLAGCHKKAGTLPVDSPMAQFQAPDPDSFNEDSDSDSAEPGEGDAASDGAE